MQGRVISIEYEYGDNPAPFPLRKLQELVAERYPKTRWFKEECWHSADEFRQAIFACKTFEEVADILMPERKTSVWQRIEEYFLRAGFLMLAAMFLYHVVWRLIQKFWLWATGQRTENKSIYSDMEQRITSLLLPAPEAELEASCKELDEKVTWLLHNSRKMDNYLELEPFSKNGRLCAHVCDTLKSLPETPTLAAYKDYKAIIILLGMSTTHYAILDELAEQHRKRDEIPELTAYCDALHWMRAGRQYLCNVYNTVCHAFHLLRRNPVRDNRLLVTEKELRHAERMLPELGRQTFTEMVRLKGCMVYDAGRLAD